MTLDLWDLGVTGGGQRQQQPHLQWDGSGSLSQTEIWSCSTLCHPVLQQARVGVPRQPRTPCMHCRRISSLDLTKVFSSFLLQ